MNKRGFTLIEILLYVAITSLMLGALTTMIFLTYESRARSHVANEVEQQGLYIFNRLDAMAHDSEAIQAPSSSTSSSTLTLTRQDNSEDPTVISLSGTTLMISHAGSPPQPLHNDQIRTTSFVVSNLSRAGTSGVVQIQATFEFVNEGDRSEYGYSKSFQGSWEIYR